MKLTTRLMLALGLTIAPTISEAQREATCPDLYATIATGHTHDAYSYIMQIWRRLDETAIANGCPGVLGNTAGGVNEDALVAQIEQLCRSSSSPPSTAIPLYGQVVTAYQRAQANARFANSAGFGSQNRTACQ